MRYLSSRLFQFVVACVLVALVAACSKKSEQTASPAQSSNSAPVAAKPAGVPPPDPSTAATITGVVKFKGKRPAPEKIDMTSDPACAQKETAADKTFQAIPGKGDNVEGAVVYITAGPGMNVVTNDQQPVTIDQRGCTYHPRIVAVEVGQPVVFTNSDETMHNVHATPRRNSAFNVFQDAHARPLTRTFTEPELMMPIGCNQHAWMKMYVSVFPNPYFAVTDADGRFTIKDLPPGTYTIAATQDKAGTQRAELTIGPKETKTVTLTLQSNAAL